jgi:hypothetical protein
MILRIRHPDNAATARSLRHNSDAMFYSRLKWRAWPVPCTTLASKARFLQFETGLRQSAPD